MRDNLRTGDKGKGKINKESYISDDADHTAFLTQYKATANFPDIAILFYEDATKSQQLS